MASVFLMLRTGTPLRPTSKFGDASKDGLAFWAPQSSSAFIGDPILDDDISFNIFLNEALAILATLEWSMTLLPTPSRVAIHTDSSNLFDIFNSLRASGPYNSILLSAAMTRIDHGIDLHGFFIEGKRNTIANALSRRSLELVCKLVPDVSIHHFTPPTTCEFSVTGAGSI